MSPFKVSLIQTKTVVIKLEKYELSYFYKTGYVTILVCVRATRSVNVGGIWKYLQKPKPHVSADRMEFRKWNYR